MISTGHGDQCTMEGCGTDYFNGDDQQIKNIPALLPAKNCKEVTTA